jgi:hypothetical protein
MKCWIGNIAPGTSDEEIKALVKKYAPELTCTHLEHVEGTGSRPGVLLELDGGEGAVENLTRRLNGMYWKERMLVSSRLGI